MKKTTRAPTRAPGAKSRRKAAGTRRKTTTPRKAPKTRNKPRRKAQTKTATKAEADRSAAIEHARQTTRRLKAELAEVRRQIAELQASAETDFLLNILNRRGFERELNRSIAYIKRYRATGAVIMLDVDRLKPINDTFGHAAGDEVLKAVAATLAAMVRASDVVGRHGGDEFVVLLWNLSETDARAKAQALEQAIDALRFSFGGRTVTVGASAGTAILSPQTDTRRVLEEADSAMYVRKAQRRHEAEAAGA
jgi:diguanylate cyclase (GGDEF)-like protein